MQTSQESKDLINETKENIKEDQKTESPIDNTVEENNDITNEETNTVTEKNIVNNNENVAEIIEALKQLGLSEKEIEEINEECVRAADAAFNSFYKKDGMWC